MREYRSLRLIPDWPRVRKLVAERLGKSEDDVQALKGKRDSLDRVGS